MEVTGADRVRTEILDAGSTLIEYFVLEEKTLAWVIDREQVRCVDLAVSSADLRHQTGLLRNLIAARSPEAREEAGRLYAAVFAPLVPYVRHSHLIIVPHGPLHYLPFAALYDGSARRYLAETYTLTLAPSASALRFVLAKRKPIAAPLLVLGDPDGSLPHAGQEARTAAGIYGGTARLGGEARESRLHQEAAQAGLIHLAAHASYDPVQPLFTLIELAPGGGASRQHEHADGRLHVYEVYGLDLKNASLAVLSACDTALGPRSAGDDIIGLPRAFLYAGAPSVVTTLWPIDDAATAFFMETFYRRLQAGAAKAEALQAAQGETLKQESWREPYFWAAFTLTGDWR
jgi:CHAT domain-containing protein